MGHPALELADHWVELVFLLKQRSLGELLPIDIMWDWEVSGRPTSWTQLSHLGGSGLTPGQSTETLTATWLRRKGRKKEADRTPNQMVKAKLNRQSHTKKHTNTHS